MVKLSPRKVLNIMGWKRSKYPLQGGVKESTKMSKDGARPASSQLSERTQSTAKPESRSPTNTTYTDLSKSHAETNGIHPTSDSLNKSQKDNDTADAQSTVSHSSSVNAAPVATYHDVTTMDSVAEKEKEDEEEDTQEQDEPSSPEPRARSLRRSQRNQRLEAQSKGSVQEEMQLPQSAENHVDAAATEANSEQKQESSQGAASNLLAMFDRALPSSVSDAENKPKGLLQQLKKRDENLPASPPQTESEAGSASSPTTGQNDEAQPAAAKTQTWRSRKYPLQIPLEGANSQWPPTPVSPTNNTEHQAAKSQDSHGSSAQASGPTSTPQTQNYPLQSPVAAVEPKHSSEQPATTSARPDSTEVKQSPAATPDVKAVDTPSKKKRLSRQVYPLQSPASIANLREHNSPSTQGHQENESQPQTEDKTLSDDKAQPDHNAPSTDKVKTPRKGRYPLQSSASYQNFEESQSPSGSRPSSPLSQKRKPSVITQRRESYRRGYPLQIPVNPGELSTENNDNQTPTVNHHEDSRDGPVPRVFRRTTYPLSPSVASANPWHSHSHSSSNASEAGDEDHSSGRHPPPPYRGRNEKMFLPKNLRAVENTEKKLKGRTIVVCLDGTGDKFDDDNSNIVHIVSALKKDDSHQVTYYQAGIGTYNDGGLSSGFQAALDMAVGSGLGLHVRDAYHFLMHSYKEGDRICIFGFSRGAYTARCLAGMVHKVGLLPPRNIQQIQFAYEFYKDDSARGWQQSEDFKRAFSIDVNIHFIGCFDSVASVGFIPRQLPLSSTPNNKARYFRHAMALDERRAKFKICRFQSAKTQGELDKLTDRDDSHSDDESVVSKALNKIAYGKEQGRDQPPKYSPDTPYGKESHPNMTEAEYDRLYGHEDNFDTDVSEVWFSGCHADVGGGAVANTERHKLAQIPLRWMIRQTFECNTGIIWKTRMLAEYGLDVHSLWPKYGRLDVPLQSNSPSNWLSKYENTLPPKTIRRSKLVPVERRGHEHDQGQGLDHTDHHGEPWYHFKSPDDDDWTPEQVEDYYDAMTDLNDQLVQAPTWWILEAIPVQYKMCYKPGEITVVTGPNMGLARLVEDHEAQIHWTVLHRAQRLKYKAAARPAKHTEWRVVT